METCRLPAAYSRCMHKDLCQTTSRGIAAVLQPSDPGSSRFEQRGESSKPRSAVPTISYFPIFSSFPPSSAFSVIKVY